MNRKLKNIYKTNLNSQNHYDHQKNGKTDEHHSETGMKRVTVDAWRHLRMYRVLNPILENYPDSKWLTVGDGRYGRDAQYIKKKGLDVFATDISDVFLREAKLSGDIDSYGKENAESLSFSVNEFDFILCKESYHHFSRPMVALYEMLRVSKKGVILIEPNDHAIYESGFEIAFRSLIGLVKHIFGKKHGKWNDFEKAGNYVYRISKREIEKVAMGLELKVLAFKGLNDYYIEGVEKEKLSDNGKLYRKIRRMIKIQDILALLKFRKYGILAAIIFKESPTKKTINSIKKEGYKINHLRENPYLSTGKSERWE